MSEVKRFALKLYNEYGGYSPEMVDPDSLPNRGTRPEYVLSFSYDLLHAELSALREELASAKADKDAYAQNAIDLRKRALAAEQRNSELTGCGPKRMREAARKAAPHIPGDMIDFILSAALATINPTESGASE